MESTRENRIESAEEKVGETTGGIAGALAGAELGSAAGPVGAIVGGIAGAAGGWWAGEKLGRAIDAWSVEDEAAFRTYYESIDRPDVDYDTARSGYITGFLAADNPDYPDYTAADRDFRRSWAWDDFDYDTLRPYVHRGYERRRSGIVV